MSTTVKRIDLQRIPDPRGNLSVVEQLRDVPFEIARAFLMYDVPGGEERGGHAYRENREFIIALSGSFDVVTDEGGCRTTHSLNRSYYGLYIPNGVWRHMENFSTNALALVLSSTHYSEEDYIREYEAFLSFRNAAASKVLKGVPPLVQQGFPSLEEKPFHALTTIESKIGTVFNLPKIAFREGNITPIEGYQPELEGELQLPFSIKRAFYIYDIPGGASRGAHAHKTCHQLIIAASGSFNVVLNNGKEQTTVALNRPYQALHVPPGVWSHEEGFSSGSVCLVLTSELYEEADYIRDYAEYLRSRGLAPMLENKGSHPVETPAHNAETPQKTIAFYDLKKLTDLHAEGIKQVSNRVIDSGWFLQGKEVDAFESRYAAYTGSKYCVGVGNGLDALKTIIRAYKELGKLKDGDEVIVPANTYIATILSISSNSLTPVLIEPDPRTLQLDPKNLEPALTSKTRAVMLVHLYGQNAWTQELEDFCTNYKLLLFEDNAQAAGAVVRTKSGHKKTGALGHAGAHSFYPTKTLGALGDAGAVTTDDDDLARIIRSLANYGSNVKNKFPFQGNNSRLDEMQAAILNYKLDFLDTENERRRSVARLYMSGLDNPLIEVPLLSTGEDNVCHLFPILVKEKPFGPGVGNSAEAGTPTHGTPEGVATPLRDELQRYLAEQGIQTQIHYPIPPHKQHCYREWNGLSYPITEAIHSRELSLPIGPVMTDEEVYRVIKTINSWKP